MRDAEQQLAAKTAEAEGQLEELVRLRAVKRASPVQQAPPKKAKGGDRDKIKAKRRQKSRVQSAYL